MAPRGPGEQVSFRVKLPVARQIRRGAESEDLALADFVRKVFMVGMREYQRAGSLHAIRALEEAEERGRQSVEIDRRAQAHAGDLIAEEDSKQARRAKSSRSRRTAS
jgi:hypothetical protein